MGKKVYLKKNDTQFLNFKNIVGNQFWTMDNDDLIKHNSGLCLEILSNKLLVMNKCDKNNERQRWIWKHNEKKILN